MSSQSQTIKLGCWNDIGVAGNSTCPELLKHIHCRNCPVYTQAGQALYDRIPPAGYVDEWTERIAAPDPPPPAETLAVILFRVGSEWLALDVSCTIEVSPMRPVRRVPHHSDQVFRGLVNIRGELQLALSLAELLNVGLAESVDKLDEMTQQRMLVVDYEQQRWVLIVDQVEDICHFREMDLRSLPATVATGTRLFTRGVFQRNGKSIGYLDPGRLFTSLRRSFR